jgi:hypothetical protein
MGLVDYQVHEKRPRILQESLLEMRALFVSQLVSSDQCDAAAVGQLGLETVAPAFMEVACSGPGVSPYLTQQGGTLRPVGVCVMTNVHRALEVAGPDHE